LLLVVPGIARAQHVTKDVVAVDTVAPGVVHSAILRVQGPWTVHVVAIDLRGGRYRLTSARAQDSLRGRERTSDMVRRARSKGLDVVAAINADFFDLRGDGANENNQMIGGRVLKGVPVTDSPFDTFRNAHTQFAMTTGNRPVMDRFVYSGTIERRWGPFCRFHIACKRERFQLDGVNVIPRKADALVLFTEAWGAAPRTDTTRWQQSDFGGFAELPLSRFGEQWIPSGATRTESRGGIAHLGGMLVAYGRKAVLRLDSLATKGDPFDVRDGFRPNDGPLAMIVGGWPRIVRDGANIAARADSTEGTFPRFSATRHPRSGIGFSRDSATVFLITVDGRQESSDGMSLVELADEMLRLGVWQGLNLDGGGSTTLVIGGRLVNKPSDSGGERAVGNAVLVVRR
jgi:hypothetical protein